MTHAEKPRVLFIGELNTELEEYKSFISKFECIFYTLTTVDELVEKFQHEFSDIVGVYGAWLGFIPLGGFEGKLLDAAPESLKIIAMSSVGYDNFDGPLLRSKGIVLSNVPSVYACEPVAELVLFNAIQSFRNFKPQTNMFHDVIQHTVLARQYAGTVSNFDNKLGKIDYSILKDSLKYQFGHYLANRANISARGHEVVIVGFGPIGKCIAEKLNSLGMKINYVKRSPLSEKEEAALGFPAKYYSSIEETSEIADLVVIACPGTEETKHLINAKVIDAFAKPIRIINIGRGTVIDEQALVDGLQSGKIIFAGLDVYEEEPTVHMGLLNRDDVYLTPHIGASTVENFDYAAVSALKNIEDVYNGGQGKTPVN